MTILVGFCKSSHIYYLIPIIFMAAITTQIKVSFDKHMFTYVSHIKLSESGMHVINVLLLTKRKRMTCRWHSTMYLQEMGLAGNNPHYLQGTHIHNSLCIYMRYASATCQIHSHCQLIKPTTSVYIVHKKLIHHQLVVHMLARNKGFLSYSACPISHGEFLDMEKSQHSLLILIILPYLMIIIQM